MASPSNLSIEDMKPYGNEVNPYSLGQRAQKTLGLELKPIYKEIKAVYINIQNDESQQISQGDMERHGFFVMSAIGKGEQVTKTDITEMRQAQINTWMGRTHLFTIRRHIANFIGLNMCNMLVLVLLTILSFMMYQNNDSDCPNFSKATLFYTVLSGIWALTTLMGIHSANKRIVKNIRYYIIITLVIMALMIIATAYGLIEKDSNDTCNKDSSQTFFMIAVGVFSILDVGFFSVMAKKLREILIRDELSQRRRNNRNNTQNRNNAQNRNAAADRDNRQENIAPQGQVERGNRSARGERRRQDGPYRV